MVIVATGRGLVKVVGAHASESGQTLFCVVSELREGDALDRGC